MINTKEKHCQENIDNVFFYNNKALKTQSLNSKSLVRSLEWKQNFEKDTNLRSYFKNKLWI